MDGNEFSLVGGRPPSSGVCKFLRLVVVVDINNSCSSEAITSCGRSIGEECDVLIHSCFDGIFASFKLLFLALGFVRVAVHDNESGQCQSQFSFRLVLSDCSMILFHELIASFLQLGFFVRCFTVLFSTRCLGLSSGNRLAFSMSMTAFCAVCYLAINLARYTRSVLS